ncbi:EamA family transporter [Paenibacillus favisporus]|uniref:EamA family transporter n=1 Tax=Paenibacillus favisporus TaxID=221028 RepID=UPI003D2CAEF5
MIIFISIVLILINSFAQVLLKIGANKISKKFGITINIQTILGYFLFFISTILSVYLLKFIDLKNFTIIIALNYVGAIVLSYLILRESFTKQKIISTIMIILGVIIFNI